MVLKVNWMGKGRSIGAEQQQGQALQKDRGADGADQGHQGMGPPERPEGHPLQDHAQNAGGRHARGKGQEKIDLAGGQEQHRDKGPEHVNLTLGEVDQAQDAVNHGVAQGDEGVNAAGGEAVE